jgi:all-trans-retinol dehydrogenase (NAD+)
LIKSLKHDNFFTIPMILILFVVFLLGITYLHKLYKIIRQKDVKGKIVLITGGASGIGRQMALGFSALGAIVVLWDIVEDGLKKVASEIAEKGGKVYTYYCNVAKREMVYQVAEKVQKEVGKVDILVNNAGIVAGRPFLELSDDAAQRTLDVNIAAHFWTVKAFLPAMVQSNSGHLVTIASAAGIIGVHGLADYCASKWAAFGFDESIRMELRKKKITGVKTTCVCPFYINTGMFEGVKTKVPWLLPILDEKWVANEIITAVRRNYAHLFLPRAVKLPFLCRFLFPTEVCDWIADFLGINETMDDFKGRQQLVSVKDKQQ